MGKYGPVERLFFVRGDTWVLTRAVPTAEPGCYWLPGVSGRPVGQLGVDLFAHDGDARSVAFANLREVTE